jgi:hypothetical protein
MARQHKTSQRLISIVQATLVVLGLVILLEKLDGPVAHLITGLLRVAAGSALELLLSLAPAAGQTLQGYAVDHMHFSPCPLETLVSLWPLLHVIAAAA